MNVVERLGYLKLVMSSSDSFTNFETTIFFRETEFFFIYSYVVKMKITRFNFVKKIGKKW